MANNALSFTHLFYVYNKMYMNFMNLNPTPQIKGNHFFGWMYMLCLLIVPISLRSQTEKTLFSDPESALIRETNTSYLLKWAQADSIRYYSNRARAVAFAKKMGYPVEGESNGRRFFLTGTDELGQLSYLETNNFITGQFLGTSALYPGGDLGLNLTGNGTTIAVWEIGRPLLTHAALVGRITQKDNSSASIGDHATHVSGTLIGADLNSAARGMSYEANLNAYDVNGDFTEMAAAAANPDFTRLSSHSYGKICGWSLEDDGWYWYGNTAISTTEDYKFGLYNSESAALDNIARNAPFYMPIFAAGNDRNDDGPTPGSTHKVMNANGVWISSTAIRNKDNNGTGYGCITPFSSAKNVLSVGAISVTEDDGLFFQSMSSFSNWGPTDDGRIKPDVVAPGVGVYSSISTNNVAYAALSGTSMATPAVAGSINLLLQQYNELNPGFILRASALKALVIHTASSEADGPNYSAGWGTVNISAAAEFINQSALTQGRDRLYSRDSITNGAVRNRSFYHDGLSPVKVTVAWTDPAGPESTNTLNPTALRLVNDLDVRIINTNDGTVYDPWVLNPSSPGQPATTGDNFRDNVEQIYIESLPEGSYTIRVTHKGTLVGGPQIFSVMLSGRASQSTCEGNTLITNCSGTISDGSGSNNYSNDLDCSWTIAPAGASSVTLTFTAFQTESFEFVTVYDGMDENAPVLGEFEGNALPPTLTASSGKMFITFITDGSVTFPGWSANYTCAQQTLSVNPDALTFAAGGGANATTVTANCAWSIQDIPVWLSVSPTSGSESTVVGIICDPNNSTQDRSAVLTVTACGGLTKTITIGQFGCTVPTTVPVISAGGSTELCPNQTVTLTASNVCAGCTVQWSNGQTGNAITVSAPGNYSTTYSNSCGQGSVSNSISITAKPGPTVPIITAGGSTELCLNQTVTLTASNVCAGCAVTWSNGQTGNAITVSAPGNYSATYSNTCGLGSVSNSISITAKPAPTVPVIASGGPTTLCPNQTVTLTASNVCAGCTVTWSGGQIGNAITVSAPGNYSATYSNGCGQGGASNSISVVAQAGPTIPVVVANGPTTFCNNGTVTLIASNVCPDCTIAWSNGQTGSFINVSTTGNYTASYTNTCGQGAPSVSTPVTVLLAPETPVITPLSTTDLCPEQEVKLVATNVCNGCIVNWSNGQSGSSVDVSTPGNYSATYSNACGIGSVSNTVVVTAQQMPPAPEIIASGPTTLCPGQTVTLTAANICSDCSVLWSNSQTGPVIVVNSTGNYSASYVNVCGAGQASNVITATVTGPFTPIVQLANLCNLSAPDGGSNYQWYFNNVPIQGANTSVYTAQVTGFYNVSMTSSTGCDGVSGAVLAQPCVSSTDNPDNTTRFVVYPNPASRNLTIECFPEAGSMDIKVDVFNIEGAYQATIYQGEIGAGYARIECNLPALPQGVYAYRIQSQKGSIWGQLIILEGQK